MNPIGAPSVSGTIRHRNRTRSIATQAGIHRNPNTRSFATGTDPLQLLCRLQYWRRQSNGTCIGLISFHRLEERLLDPRERVPTEWQPLESPQGLLRASSTTPYVEYRTSRASSLRSNAELQPASTTTTSVADRRSNATTTTSSRVVASTVASDDTASRRSRHNPSNNSV